MEDRLKIVLRYMFLEKGSTRTEAQSHDGDLRKRCCKVNSRDVKLYFAER